MKKLISVISILFIVMLVESSSASFIFRVDPRPGYQAVVEDETIGGTANLLVSESGELGAFSDEVLDGSGRSVYKYSQWDWLFH